MSPYQYNASNELTTVPSGSYTYDNNGSELTDPSGKQYTWDFENRLTQVVLPSGGGTVTFKYDPFGRRVQKAFTQGSTTTTTNYLYDGENVIEEVDNSGNLLGGWPIFALFGRVGHISFTVEVIRLKQWPTSRGGAPLLAVFEKGPDKWLVTFMPTLGESSS